MRFLEARLDPSQDKYPMGPSNMFFQLFHRSRFFTRYTTFFWMEADVWPCRRHWLTTLYHDHAYQTEFWIRGSILRDTETRKDYSSWNIRYHLNGNAWYRIGDAAFRRWMVDRVEAVFRKDTNRYLDSYDIAIDLIRRDPNFVSWKDEVDTAHRFVYTETIQNRYVHCTTALCQSMKFIFPHV
jgi:hypothetical protein